MEYMHGYNKWLNSTVVDSETKTELLNIAEDKKEIEERFYRELEFGTAGLRGILGAGTNRMNIYTVRKATQGLADFISSLGEDAKQMGVAISYDSRINSDVFAKETAAVLAANGIKSYLSDALRPVPQLSYAVRHFGAIAGVMVTASHNPPEYNGYKVYGEDGGQMPPEAADKVLAIIEKLDIFADVKTGGFEKAKADGFVQMFGTEFDEAYYENVLAQRLNPEAVEVVKDDFKLIYTPLHGSGNVPVRKILEKSGFKNVLLVDEQLEPDGRFPTVKSPNPENKEAFTLAIEKAKKEDVDLIIGTDPDCDRIGVVVRDSKGEYIALTGNMVGALLTEYVLSIRKQTGNLPENGVVIKTIVTSYMPDAICRAYGTEVMNVFTGFKFIGEKIKQFEKDGSKTYLLGFEESYGYLVGTYARDKDAVVASMLVAEMAAYYKMRGMTLYEGLLEIYAKYGTYRERLVSLTFGGMDGAKKIGNIMETLRNNAPKTVAGKTIKYFTDYKTGFKTDIETGKSSAVEMPKSNVLFFELENETWCAVRPSGTEPKIKFYFGTKAGSIEEAEKILDGMVSDINAIIEKI